MLTEKTWNFRYTYIEGIHDDALTDIEELFSIDPLDIEDIATDTQLSKIELREAYLYLALQLPQYDPNTKKIVEKELHYIIGHDFVIAINKHYMAANHQFECNAPEILPSDTNPLEYMYEMIDAMITHSFKTVSNIKLQLGYLEADIFDDEKTHDKILDIQTVKRNIINIQSLLIPLQSALVELQNKPSNLILSLSNHTQHHEKMDDTLDKLKKMIVLTHNYKEQIAMLSESNEALTARSTNEIIKRLTAISLLILIPNIITSFFGMNIYFGWGQNSDSFIPLSLILSVTLGLTICMFFILKRIKWF